MTRFYQGDLMDLWSWIAQLLFPVLGLIIAAWSAGGRHGDELQVRSNVVFWGALILSLFYVCALYLVVWLEPLSSEDWSLVFRSSGFYLGIFQTVVITALGKFFIENIHQ
ncbi:MAG: hypothetical protein C5B58_10255 [Acidobacteria bacterium]|nr:MAG: hypothetical protein C5B58_10255 [Acidobacteriota bacterium]